MSCGDCGVISLYCMCCSINGSVCLVLDSVCELYGETISNMFECGCYFVVECYGRCLVWVGVFCWINRVWSSKKCA